MHTASAHIWRQVLTNVPSSPAIFCVLTSFLVLATHTVSEQKQMGKQKCRDFAVVEATTMPISSLCYLCCLYFLSWTLFMRSGISLFPWSCHTRRFRLRLRYGLDNDSVDGNRRWKGDPWQHKTISLKLLSVQLSFHVVPSHHEHYSIVFIRTTVLCLQPVLPNPF